MLFKLNPLPAIASTVFLACGFMLAGTAQADVTLNAGAKMSSESNVNGSPDQPTTANQLRDSYRVLSASAVYFTPLDADKTSYFIGQVGANSSTYSKYNSLDNSSVMASVGLYQQLSSSWSGTVTGRGFSRTTKQDERNAKGNGATLEIKSQLSETAWAKGTADYESSNANLDNYSNTGKTYGLSLGYIPLKDTFLNLGYNQSVRDYKATSFQATSQTLYADVTQRLAKNWYLNGGYAVQKNVSNLAGSAYTNNIVSLGLSFSY